MPASHRLRLRRGERVAQSFRAAYIDRAKALHYKFNKDVLRDKNENYFMPSVLYPNFFGKLKGYTPLGPKISCNRSEVQGSRVS